MPSAATALAHDLLEIGAVALRPDEPFTWASGRRSPVYTDNRLTLAYPAVRARIAEAFAALVDGEGLEPDVIAGTATAGIPHATLLAETLGLPLAYVRSSAKAHGRGNQIEGRVEAGQRVVVVEDLVSTGGSALAAAEAVRAAGAEPVAVVAVFSYGLDAAGDAFRKAGVPLHVLTTYDQLAEVAADTGALAPESLDVLRAWRENPSAWSVTRGGAE
jgi:orotate phosphoribosyltransferase